MKTNEEWESIHEYIKTHEWKAIPCFTGEECWCRLIQCVDIPEGGDPDNYTLNNSGSIGKDMAEFIVTEHNRALTRTIWKIDLATCTQKEKEEAMELIRKAMND